MKLRIKGNSVRLRISRTELVQLGAGKGIEERTQFGPLPNSIFRYSLISVPPAEEISVSFLDGHVQVSVPTSFVREWITSNQVGFHAKIQVGGDEPLDVSLEKDFACLDKSAEENSDTFENPRAGKPC